MRILVVHATPHAAWFPLSAVWVGERERERERTMSHPGGSKYQRPAASEERRRAMCEIVDTLAEGSNEGAHLLTSHESFIEVVMQCLGHVIKWGCIPRDPQDETMPCCPWSSLGYKDRDSVVDLVISQVRLRLEKRKYGDTSWLERSSLLHQQICVLAQKKAGSARNAASRRKRAAEDMTKACVRGAAGGPATSSVPEENGMAMMPTGAPINGRPADINEKASKKGKKGMHTKSERRRKEKDPDAPKQARTAFNFFMDEYRPQYKKDNPSSKGVVEVTKAGSERWRKLSEEDKKPYKDKARVALEAYHELKDAYEAKGGKKRFKLMKAPPRPPTAYLIFFDDFRAEYAEKSGTKRDVMEVFSLVNLNKAAGLAWRALGPESKKPYAEKADKAREMYEELKGMTPEERVAAVEFEKLAPLGKMYKTCYE